MSITRPTGSYARQMLDPGGWVEADEDTFYDRAQEGAGGYLGQGGGTEHAGGLGADGTSCPPAVDRSHRQTRSQRVCR